MEILFVVVQIFCGVLGVCAILSVKEGIHWSYWPVVVGNSTFVCVFENPEHMCHGTHLLVHLFGILGGVLGLTFVYGVISFFTELYLEKCLKVRIAHQSDVGLFTLEG